MPKDINYPIKYAILALKEDSGWLNNYEDIIRGYIVSKCYVVESSMKYFADGSSEISHKVIFPYKNLTILKKSLRFTNKSLGQRIIPGYDFNYNPYPIDNVPSLFDTYEEAKEEAEKENKKMQHQLILKVPYNISDPRFKQTLANYEKTFLEQLAVCQIFEQLSLYSTEDVQITNDININKGLQLLKK